MISPFRLLIHFHIMEELLLDKEKIRTMRRDMQEAEGVLVYPREENGSVDLLATIKECSVEGEAGLDVKGCEIEKIAPEEEKLPVSVDQCLVIKDEEGFPIEKCPPNIDSSVEQEKFKAENLAQEIAVSSNESEDNIKEKVLQNESLKEGEALFADSESAPAPEPIQGPEFNFVEIPQEEIEPEPIPEPLPEEIRIEEKIPDTLPIEEKLPSAKELGLEEAEPEKIPSAEELGLEEAAKETANEELKKIDENEQKLEKIAEATFELEEKMKKVTEEKAPFEKRRAEIEEEIDNIKKKLDLIIERKIRVDEIKKDLEAKESVAQNPEEKRSAEKERWKVEDDRNAIEKEKDEKEDEIKSLRLQMRECELNSEKVLVKEKEINQGLEILKRDRDRIILGQTKHDLLKRLEPLEGEIENIKREMFENTKLKDKAEKGLNDIKLREKAVEDEIKILERRQTEAKDEVILRDIETRRRTIEDSRRQLEKDRWDVEDKMGDLEEKRKLIKEKYQEVAAQVKQIKAELTEIEEKIK